MKILIISQRAIIPRHQHKFRLLAENSNVQIKILMPYFWKERSSGSVFHYENVNGHNKFKTVTYKSFSSKWFSRRVIFFLDVWQALKFHPDILWVDDEPTSRLLTKWIRIKRLFMPWGRVFCTARDPRYKQLSASKKKIEKVNYQQLSCIFSTNKIVSNNLLRKGFGGKIIELPSEFQFDEDQQQKSPLDIKKSLGLNQQVVGYIEPKISKQALFILLESFARIPLNFSLLIVGQSNDKKEIQEKLEALGLNSRTKLVGEFDYPRIKNYLSAMDVLIDPTYDPMVWSELMADVLNDAASMDIPVIGLKSGLRLDETYENITNSSDKRDEISQSIKSVLNDFEKREEVIKRGRRNLFKTDPQQFTSSTISFLKSTLK